MDERPINQAALFGSLPPEWPEDVLPAIRESVRASGARVVVLDDDPTGTQTVHDVHVLGDWSVRALTAELGAERSVFYILTNSRSLPLPEAQALNAEIGRNLRQASGRAGRQFVVVSRSDSTLRGHFPGEVQALSQALGGGFDAWLVAPFFEEGGRYTIGDIHYVADGDQLTPAGQTPFARDVAFGYRASNLREWVEEKTGGRILASSAKSISIEDIRCGGPERVAESLASLDGGAACIVNAASRRDMDVFVLGLLEAESRGKRFLYRTAASFVAARAGISPRPLLGKEDFDLPERGGVLVVVGSHVPRTSEQLAHVLEHQPVEGVELKVSRVLVESECDSEIQRAVAEAEKELARDRSVVVYTSRELLTGSDAAETLSIGRQVSASLVTVVRALRSRPRCVIAKGGITSSDVATEALGMKRALVLGQVLPGVPVWRLGDESARPGLPYVVFPGNVGGPGALTEIVRMLAG